MGWIKELDDLLSKSKKMKALFTILLSVVIICVGYLTFFIIKNGIQGHSVKVGTVELPEITDAKKDKRNDSNAQIIDAPHNSILYPIPMSDAKKLHQKRMKKKDTAVANNQSTVSGNGNHVITGNGNAVGVNGDKTAERQFGISDQLPLLNKITEVQHQYNIQRKCIVIGSTSNSNGGKFAAQMEEFLVSKGYSIDGHMQAFTQSTIKGVQIGAQMGCIFITVGVL
jgi:hypothetical protein